MTTYQTYPKWLSFFVSVSLDNPAQSTSFLIFFLMIFLPTYYGVFFYTHAFPNNTGGHSSPVFTILQTLEHWTIF